jgi:hypothetical protein
VTTAPTRPTGPPSPPITGITGGVGGTAATYSSMLALAQRFDEAGDRMRGWAAGVTRLAAAPDLVESAPLSPVTFAEAEAALIDAATGVHGVLVSSVDFEADAVAVRATVRALEQCDRLVAEAMHTVDYDLGRAFGTALVVATPPLLLTLAGAAPVAAAAGSHLPPRERRRLAGDLDVVADTAQETLDRHPGLLQHAVDGGGGLLDGLLGGVGVLTGVAAFHPTVADAAGDLAVLYGAEEPPSVRARHDLSVPLGQTTPRCVADLMRHLDQANALSTADRPGDQGTLEIQTLVADDGSVRRVVYLPGTDDLTTAPWARDDDVRDLATNLRLVAGDPTTYAAGIERAMHEAGIGPHDPVLLVGHSQGGMEAAALLAHGSPFQVTDVVTAGSPLAQVEGYPPGSHVLSLENRGDVVPLLDGADNDGSRQHVTVHFDDHETSVVANHTLAHYVRGAEVVDASPDPSIREQVRALHRRGFLSGRVTASQVFQVTR